MSETGTTARVRGGDAYRGPRLALSRIEAAAALGMSINSFERHVQPELKLIRRGRMRLVPVRELERWVEANAERPLDAWR